MAERPGASLLRRSTVDGDPVNPQVVRIGEDEGRRALLVDGVVQSVALEGLAAREGYWTLMLPDVRPRRALLLGYGGGTLAALLERRFGPLQIVGVDDDPAVLALAAALHDPPPGVELVLADAFQWVQGDVGRFDFIALDLFRAMRMPRGTFSRPFLRRLRQILAPGGTVAVNLFLDGRVASRLQRLEQVFTIRERRRVGKNLVALCR